MLAVLMLLAQTPHFEEQVAPGRPRLLSIIVRIPGVNVYTGTLEKQRYLSDRMSGLEMYPYWAFRRLGNVDGFFWKCYLASWSAPGGTGGQVELHGYQKTQNSI